jgi:hypothetical protein
MASLMRPLTLITTAAAAFVLTAGVAGAGPALPLNPEQETSTVVSDASGFFTYEVTGSELCYTLEVRNMTADPFAAHIHIGARHVAGPVVVPLVTPPGATSTASACVTATEGGPMTPAELAGIVADPRAYYVNVHTVNYPGGEIRGQLK